MPTQPKVLLISSDEAESNELEGVLREHVILTSASNLSELESNLTDCSYDAVFCGWSFHAGTWNAALEQVQKQCPDLPVIIYCGAGGEREWVEVLNAGGFDLLVAPYQRNSVVSILEHARASYEARLRHKSAGPFTATA